MTKKEHIHQIEKFIDDTERYIIYSLDVMTKTRKDLLDFREELKDIRRNFYKRESGNILEIIKE